MNMYLYKNIHTCDCRKKSTRLRKYRLYYNKKKYIWKGPCLRQILKLVCPLSELNMDADSMYWMLPSELAHCHILFRFIIIVCLWIYAFETNFCNLKFSKFDQLRSNLWEDQSTLSWTSPPLHSNTRGSTRKISPTDWFGNIEEFYNMFSIPMFLFFLSTRFSLLQLVWGEPVFYLRICPKIPAQTSSEGVAALLMEVCQHLQQAVDCCTSI